jgi:hypothetical protein
MSSLMVWRLSGRKISASFRFVISRVLEGGVGMDRGGTFERSIDMDVRDAFEDERDKGGELSADMLVVGSQAYETESILEGIQRYRR